MSDKPDSAVDYKPISNYGAIGDMHTAPHGSTLRACLRPYLTYARVENSNCPLPRASRQGRATRARRTCSQLFSSPSREESSSQTSCPVSWKRVRRRDSKNFTELSTPSRVKLDFESFSSPD